MAVQTPLERVLTARRSYHRRNSACEAARGEHKQTPTSSEPVITPISLTGRPSHPVAASAFSEQNINHQNPCSHTVTSQNSEPYCGSLLNQKLSAQWCALFQ